MLDTVVLLHAELVLGEEVDLDVVDGDARVAGALRVFKAPEFFGVFVEYADGFAFLGHKATDDAKPLVGLGCVGVLMSAFLPTAGWLADPVKPELVEHHANMA